jgi:hypothetical protein
MVKGRAFSGRLSAVSFPASRPEVGFALDLRAWEPTAKGDS